MTTRADVIVEAESWLGTPFHHEARVKGVGIDCLMLLAEVYERVGLIDHVVVPHYPPDWHLHRDVERYLDGLLGYAPETDERNPGNVALFRFGRAFSHGTIIVEWPRLIHAYWRVGVVWGDASQYPLVGRDVKFFDPFSRCRTT